MKVLGVFVLPFLCLILQNVRVVELKALKQTSKNATATDPSSFRVNFVNNLLDLLFKEVKSKKMSLEDPKLWPNDFGPEYIREGPMRFHYIIVGAGTAGSVVASRLSENPNVSVLLLEAGDNPPIHSEIHPLSLVLLNTTYTWEDFAEPSPSCCQGMKDERCFWPRGRMIGGTGALNGNIFLTGYAEDFDEWEKQGNKGWAWKDVQPFYQKATTKIDSEISPKGSLILDNFQRLENYDTLKKIMIKGTEEVEQKFPLLKSYGYNENINATVSKEGVRMSTGKTYLAKVASTRSNLYVIKNSLVTKILFENDVATGVQFVVNGKSFMTAECTQEIILSAGSFNSPKLLMLSGVGPKEHLESLNITVVKDLPVGENFQDHGMMPLVFKFTKNMPYATDDVTPNNLYEYLMFRRGPLVTSPTLIGFMQTLHEFRNKNPDIMLVTHLAKPTPYSNVFSFLQFKDSIVQSFLRKVGNATALEIEGLLVKPKSKGFIKLNSKDPLQGPLIHNNLGFELEDQETLLRFVRLMQELEKTSTFQYYGLKLITIPIEECDKFLYDSNAYWFCYIRYFFISSWHAAGTCRMGPATDPSAVLDERLRVHGIKGLRVIDASIMPNITSGNTNGPTIMIAEKGAQIMKDDWKYSPKDA